jgi:PAS domain S-box-containing protein
MAPDKSSQTEPESLPPKPVSPGANALRWLQRLMPAFATAALAAVLLFAMYFTDLDWQWVTFLGGVLFAALLALVSRASKAEWSIARRTAQLGQARSRLEQETLSRKRAETAFETTEEKLRLVADAIPEMLLYVNAEQQVEFHNRAFREWIGLRAGQIQDHKLNEVFGAGTYGDVQAYVIQALGGQRITFERDRTMANGIPCRLSIAYLPHRNKRGDVLGFLSIVVDITQRGQASAGTTGPDETPETEPEAITASEEPVSMNPSLVIAKARGQALYLNSINQQLTRWSDPEARLRQAFERNEFRLFSQKIVPVDGKARGSFHEIFIRLQEEEDAMASPGAFIPLVEHLNMTADLDQWVIRNVIDWHRDARKNTPHWHEALYGINLFPATISDPRFGAFLQGELARGEIPPEVLCFEIQEAEAIERPAAVKRLVSELTRLGCRVALGSFGGGMVSFDTLNHFPVQFLKIDASIMWDIEANPVNLAKIKAIGRVSKAIGVRTVAQFVESIELLPKLGELGIDYAQGYGISHPHPIDEIQSGPALAAA